MIKPRLFKMAQVITIRLSQALLSSTVLPEREKFMSSNATESGHNGRNRGDSEDLRVDILHDFCGLCPKHRLRQSRLAEHQ